MRAPAVIPAEQVPKPGRGRPATWQPRDLPAIARLLDHGGIMSSVGYPSRRQAGYAARSLIRTLAMHQLIGEQLSYRTWEDERINPGWRWVVDIRGRNQMITNEVSNG